jgi:hypothetical protein
METIKLSELGYQEDMITPEQLAPIVVEPLIQVVLKLVSGVALVWSLLKKLLLLLANSELANTIRRIMGAYLPV